MGQLILVRHCEPALTGVFLGQTDVPLSDAGRAHAARLWTASGALRREFAALYSSPLSRALETARAGGCEPRVLSDLRECGFGEWEGLRWEEAGRRYPEVWARKQTDWLNVAPLGGERWTEVATRAACALDIIRRGPFPAIVVAHLTVNSAVAHLLSGADPIGFRQEYGEALEFDL
jgi:ribonuclease H / adenosylcobalamin/alpha-ribazole phosphatase